MDQAVPTAYAHEKVSSLPLPREALGQSVSPGGAAVGSARLLTGLQHDGTHT